MPYATCLQELSASFRVVTVFFQKRSALRIRSLYRISINRYSSDIVAQIYPTTVAQSPRTVCDKCIEAVYSLISFGTVRVFCVQVHVNEDQL